MDPWESCKQLKLVYNKMMEDKLSFFVIIIFIEVIQLKGLYDYSEIIDIACLKLYGNNTGFVDYRSDI